MASQGCSSDVHLSIKWPERVSYRSKNLIKFNIYMYRNSRRVSFKPFLPTCYQIPRARFIQQSNNDIGTTKNHWIRNQEILRLSIFYFISFNIMVGFKAKARASAYFTKLGWRCGCIFVDGVCVCGGGWVCVCVCGRGWVYMYIWLGCVRRLGKYWEGGREEKLHH